MYTALFVDDEEDILQNLLQIIDWPVYGFETLLTAQNGVEALTLLSAHHVDLLITDIRMPEMDGIELLKAVKLSYPAIRCIFLSSYSDFSYAREAISLGVENYLLKPVRPDELENSVRKLLENLSMHKHVVQSLFLDNILYRWVTDDISPDELSERCRHISVNVYLRHYCVLLLKPLHKKNIDRLLSAFFTQLPPAWDTYHFMNYDACHVVILGGHSLVREEILRVLTSSCRDFPDTDLTAVIGTIAEGSSHLSSSYHAAQDCMLTCKETAGQHIRKANPPTILQLSDFRFNQIINYLQSVGDLPKEELLTELTAEIAGDIRTCSLQEVNTFLQEFPIRLSRQLTFLGLLDQSGIDAVINHSYPFETMPTQEDLHRYFSGILSLCGIQIKKTARHLSPVVLTAMEYISAHYSDYVSIKDFCAKYNMNASYLGFLFKKETGIFFNDYINQIRIHHAIHLLKNSNLKVAEICEKTGFTSSSYFISCFKKQTGLSPTRFRQSYLSL